jgi:hypothetical protein
MVVKGLAAGTIVSVVRHYQTLYAMVHTRASQLRPTGGSHNSLETGPREQHVCIHISKGVGGEGEKEAYEISYVVIYKQ